MDLIRAYVRRIGVSLLFATAMLFLPSVSYAVGGCAVINMVCIGCDNDDVYQVNCCIPHNCIPVEVDNGGCGGPGVCDYNCEGTYHVHLYACP